MWRRRAAAEGLTNVCFIDQLAHEATLDHVRAANVALVLLPDLPLFRTVICRHRRPCPRPLRASAGVALASRQ
jgi:hypothetical protein